MFMFNSARMFGIALETLGHCVNVTFPILAATYSKAQFFKVMQRVALLLDRAVTLFSFLSLFLFF